MIAVLVASLAFGVGEVADRVVQMGSSARPHVPASESGQPEGVFQAV
jgi:hypothetical protein